MTLAQYNTIKTMYTDLCAEALTLGVEDIDNRYFSTSGSDYVVKNPNATIEQMIVERLCASLQNSPMASSIKFNIYNEQSNYDAIKNVLFDFKPVKILNKYQSWEELYKAFLDNGIEDKGNKRGHKGYTNWQKYAKGVYQGVDYLQNHRGFEKIKKLIALDLSDSQTISADILNQIDGIAQSDICCLKQTLVCDWLKECGCMWLVKPDRHMVRVFEKLCPFCDVSADKMLKNIKNYWKNIISYIYSDIRNIKEIEPTLTPYKLDRMIYLICSGNFFKDNVVLNRQERLLNQL